MRSLAILLWMFPQNYRKPVLSKSGSFNAHLPQQRWSCPDHWIPSSVYASQPEGTHITSQLENKVTSQVFAWLSSVSQGPLPGHIHHPTHPVHVATHATPSIPVSLKSTLIIFAHIHTGHLSGVLHSGLPARTLYPFSLLPHSASHHTHYVPPDITTLISVHCSIYQPTSPWRWKRQSVPKHRHVQFTCRGIPPPPQNTTYRTRRNVPLTKSLFKSAGEKVGYCHPSGLEKTICKWGIYVPLVTKGLTL